MEWNFLGPSIQPISPRIVSLAVVDNQLVIGYEPGADGQALSQLLDLKNQQKVTEQFEQAPLSMVDGRKSLCAIRYNSDSAQLLMRQDSGNGTRALRIVKVPQPSTASAAFPYLGRSGHFASDGTLILIGSGRDRLYRINLALGESKAILPDQPLDIMDFDVTKDGEFVILDGFEQRLVWLNLMGEVVATSPLSKNEGREPQFYYLSLASSTERSAWVGLTVRQTDGSYAPEIQRVSGKIRQRVALDKERVGIGMPLVLSNDEETGAVFVADEKNSVMQISSTIQPGKPLQAPATTSAQKPTQSSRLLYMTDAGLFIESLDQSMDGIQTELNLCYENLRQVSKKAQGSYKVQLGTQGNGIEKIEVYQKDFEDFGLESCVGRALRKLKFAQRVGQQTLRVELKFVAPPRS